MYITRFAPSPTGYLHIGSIKTALYAYLMAKKSGGRFILRIEDTDRERYVADGVANILQSLYWVNLIPDEGVKLDVEQNEIMQVGENGPYIQSERLAIYQKYVDQLLEVNQAYYCFCTPERLEKLREEQQKNKLPTGYDGYCRSVSLEEAKRRVNGGEKAIVRLKMPKEGETVFNDIVRGEVRFKNELVDDQVLLKSDGFPTYHMAVVVDDHEMQVNLIIRGEEWLSSVPKHIQLYKYFGWEVPQMAHLPLLLNPDRSKLSKRQGDVAVEDYRKKGYLPEAILNFVAFLGWNPGTDDEIFTLDGLVRAFSLEKVNKAGGVFNLEKLDWYNREYIKKLTNEELVDRASEWLQEAGIDLGDKAFLAKAVSLEKERIVTLAELPEAIRFMIQLPDYDPKLVVWKKSDAEEGKKILLELKEFMNTISVQGWNKTELERQIGEWIQDKGYGTGNVLWPMRTALSGQQNSPGPYEIAEVLGKDKTLDRLDVAVGKLS